MNINSNGISVIIPVYNASEYLRESLDSLIHQDYKNFEIICVNDGSDDDSLQILNEYMEIDDRIKVITKQHTNAGDSRNIGLQSAKGKYVIFLDADDLFERTMLKEAFEKAEKERAEIVVFSGDNFADDTGERTKNPGLLRTNMVPQKVFNLNEYRGRISFTSTAPWNKLFLKSFIEENKLEFQSIQSANDLFFVTAALLVAKRIVVCDSCLIHYRVNNKNSLQGSSNKSPYDGTSALLKIYDELRKRDIYEQCRMDYNERAVSICLYLLRRIDNSVKYREFYDYLRKEFFPYVHLDTTTKEFFYNQSLYNELGQLMYNSVDEYLFKKCRRLDEKKAAKNWLFPFGNIIPKSSILIYGAGDVGKSYYNQIKNTSYCMVRGIVDQKELWIDDLKTVSPETADWNADYVVIAIENEEIALNVKRMIIDRGLIERKIVWNIIHM